MEKINTIVEAAKQICVGNNEKDFGTKVYNLMLKSGVTHNNKGRKLTVEGVTQQLKRMLYDVKKERGKQTGKGWWFTYKYVNTDKEFGMRKREVTK